MTRPLETKDDAANVIALIRTCHPVEEGSMSTGMGAALVNEIDRLRRLAEEGWDSLRILAIAHGAIKTEDRADVVLAELRGELKEAK